jgi:cytochrome c553
MKKIYIIGGVVALAGAIALVVFINRKPSATSGSNPETPGQVSDSSGSQPSLGQPGPQPPKTPLTPEMQVERNRKVNAFLAAAEVERNFQNAADLLKSLVNDLSPSEQKIMKGMLDKLSGKELVEEYRKSLAENFNDQELQELAEIYRDRDVAKYHVDAQQAMTPEGQKELMKNLETFDVSKIPSDRREVLESLADSQMKAISGAELENGLSEDEKRDLAAFHSIMRTGLMAQMEQVLKGRSVPDMRALSSKLSNPIYIKELQMRTKVTSDQMKAIEDKVEAQQKD